MTPLSPEDTEKYIAEGQSLHELLSHEEFELMMRCPPSILQTSDNFVDVLIKLINLRRKYSNVEPYFTRTPVLLYGSIYNNGDGSARVNWFLSKERAEHEQEVMNNRGGWSEECIETILSFDGSPQHSEAIVNEAEPMEEED